MRLPNRPFQWAMRIPVPSNALSPVNNSPLGAHARWPCRRVEDVGYGPTLRGRHHDPNQRADQPEHEEHDRNSRGPERVGREEYDDQGVVEHHDPLEQGAALPEGHRTWPTA